MVLNLLNSITKPTLEHFNDRLILQKLTYLAREIGFDSGFSFNWYIRGPYSPSLARLLYNMDEVDALNRTWKLNPNEERALAKTELRLKQLMGNEITDAKKLELFASVWYAMPPGLGAKGREKETIDLLLELKPRYARQEFAGALESILRFRERYASHA